MKNICVILFASFSISLTAQTQQNINKTLGTVSNPTSQIDSIRFDTNTNQMVVVTNGVSESHALAEIINITFSAESNLTPCTDGITSVTDIDGNIYPVVQIGNQCWMRENLRTTKFNNGSVIPNITDGQAWINLTTPACCNYDNMQYYDSIHGKLYNWYTVSAGNMCPTGWHVPTDAEWTTLIDFLGGEAVAGGKMKSVTGWIPINIGATNESGFSGLPGGGRSGNAGSFYDVGNFGNWWSSSEESTIYAWYRFVSSGYSVASRYYFDKRYGFSVRCLRD